MFRLVIAGLGHIATIAFEYDESRSLAAQKRQMPSLKSCYMSSDRACCMTACSRISAPGIYPFFVKIAQTFRIHPPIACIQYNSAD